MEFGFVVSKGNTPAYWAIAGDFHSHFAAISDAGGCGYYCASSSPQQVNGTELPMLLGGLLFLNETNINRLHKLIDPWRKTCLATLFLDHNAMST